RSASGRHREEAEADPALHLPRRSGGARTDHADRRDKGGGMNGDRGRFDHLRPEDEVDEANLAAERVEAILDEACKALGESASVDVTGDGWVSIVVPPE